MSKELEFTGHIAIGNGEPCPFCVTEDNKHTEDVFIMEEGKDIMEHMVDEHPSELNKALSSNPPPKLWLEEEFQLVIAKIASILKILDEEQKLVSHETFDDTMHNIYSVMKDYFNESK